MPPRQPSSIRLNEDEQELVTAWALYLQHQTGTAGGTSAVFRMLLKRAKPPDTQGADQSRIRRAYTTIFGKIEDPP